MIRFGIIGTNWITDRFIQAAGEVDCFQLGAVYSRTEERARSYALTHGIPRYFTDIDEMADKDHIDAVYIASPNSFHCSQAISFLRKGIHVLCEKPLASNEREVQEMIAAAKENGAILMEAVRTTFLPNFQLLKEKLHTIGTIRKVNVSCCKYSSRYDAYKDGTILNAFNPAFSNGALMDLGVYCIYPMAVLFGEPKEIKATGIMLDSGVDGSGTVIMKYEEMEVVATFSKISNTLIPTEIQGEAGTVTIDQIGEFSTLTFYYHNGEKCVYTQKEDFPYMYYEINEFVSIIKNGGEYESAINSYQHSLISSRVMDNARKQIGLVFPADRT
ncbi:Gfo/Idh/MocA family oxidoreductase [Rossellomorea sp. SC111]|uniref:Gfo/Idh/MocA family protein n=1 Tax=Rossellomorea sp. SC111 TaxID=2968985 RepID=UPI00215AEFEB|nr:Gfo/Idh/MocA family oxidoreductase [Rossellomorea sp. SC111]MCR8849501.1 Gfo/Idh/MocA family oxidoreductase [Rossellomorea sp. SC111]